MTVIESGVRGPGDSPVLRAMFEARKRVFVDLLKWNVPVLGGRFEVDEFDNEHASYVVLTDPSCVHVASARLLPTTRPHILGKLYSALCEGKVPSGPDVVEITRFCLDRSLGATARLAARNRLVSALAAHALDCGIRTYTGVAELGWLQQILAFGWDCRPLGAPRQMDGRWLGALAITIDHQTPTLLARNGIRAEEFASTAVLQRAA